MDLEQYKKAWKNQPDDIKVSKVEIYKMAHKKSSSILKWILIISILEFLILAIISFYPSKSTVEESEFSELFFDALHIIPWFVNGYFIYLFYKNYVKIKITENANSLMTDILKARKTVKNYMYFNLGYIFALSMLRLFYRIYIMDLQKEFRHVIYYVLVFLITCIVIFLIIGIYWLIYRLVYGTLLKKLHRNYNELRKIEN